MRAVPWNVSILFFFSRKSTPLTLPSTPSSLNFIIAARSSFGLPTAMPIFAETVARLFEQLGGMQQRLRRDASDIEAGAAVGRALFHHRGLEPELRRADRAYIAARTGADDDQIIGIWHSYLCYIALRGDRISEAQRITDAARAGVSDGRISRNDRDRDWHSASVGIRSLRRAGSGRAGRATGCRRPFRLRPRQPALPDTVEAYGIVFDAWLAKHKPSTAIVVGSARRPNRVPEGAMGPIRKNHRCSRACPR